MKAQVITQFGDPSVFKLMDVDKPILKPGHVLLKVFATSVNPIDCKIRSGAVSSVAPEFPAILHGDVAGIIDEVASDVTNFKKGDEVFGYAGGVRGLSGALAEFMLADAKLLAKKPQSLSMLEAAALPVVGITAWNALFKRAHLEKNHSILIHGGVGGVGHVAVQLARWWGAKVFTTILKEQDISLAKKFGADEVINAKEEEVEHYIHRLTNDNGFDVVFDTVGGPNLDRSLLACAANGNVVTTAARSTHDLSPMHDKGLSLHVVFVLLPLLNGIGREAHGQALSKIAEVADLGKLKPLIDNHQFNLEDVSEAHALLESGKANGKVVITIN
ncbi:MAG: zinc-dependent alcohol dehydrogenase family protein [Gammaproteobacteria bacterium]|nr:zinc-dependent alcohol dehydrogenase family protein [Gammaproteobacteria bacterium]